MEFLPYDSYNQHIIRAKDEENARLIASEEEYSSSEKEVWLDSLRSSCKEILPEGPEEIILSN